VHVCVIFRPCEYNTETRFCTLVDDAPNTYVHAPSVCNGPCD